VTGVLVEDFALYGVIEAKATALRTKLATLNAALLQVASLKSQTTIAVTNKDNARAALEDEFREVVRQIQASPTVTDAQRTALGIPVRDVIRTAAAPVAAAGLVAVGGADGNNKLTWQANGNTPGAKFRVEMRAAANLPWQLLDVVTATSYSHVGAGAGTYREYQIVTTRSAQLAAPSNTAVVFAA
jgi:hypothetical protein